jgi:hypothetical protein
VTARTNPMNDTVSEDVTLEPCPFCGLPPEHFSVGNNDHGLMIECTTKDCVNPHVSYHNPKTAIAAWNRRAYLAATKPPLAGEVEEIATLLLNMQQVADPSLRRRAALMLVTLASPPMPGRGEPPLFSKEAIEDYQFLAQMQVGIRDCIGLDREKLTIAKRLRAQGYVTIADSAQGPMIELTEAGAIKALERFVAKENPHAK